MKRKKVKKCFEEYIVDKVSVEMGSVVELDDDECWVRWWSCERWVLNRFN